MPTAPRKTAATKAANPAPDPQPVVPADADPIWAALAAPFPPDQIEKLPKPLKGRDDDKGRCQEGGRYSADRFFCGGWHARSVHLDYVGHAGITMRLNSVLGPEGWDFTPYAEGPEGLPILPASVFFAKLTIRGFTKWDVAANYNGPQEALGDALRRCAMRFGVGTYLWSKSEAAHAMAKVAEPPAEPDTQAPPPDQPSPAVGTQEEPTLTRGQFLVQDAVAKLTPEEHATLVEWAQKNAVPAIHNLTDKQAQNFLEYVEWMVGRREAAQNPPG